MTRYVLDTDTLSLLEKNHPRVALRVAAVQPSDIAISVISVEEQLTGWYTLLRRRRKRDEVAAAYRHLAAAVQFLGRLPILPFTEQAILQFERLKRQKLNIPLMDLRIAAITLEASLILVTRNRRDFSRVPGLVIEDWSL